jgi:hypothetical protein
VHHIQCTIYCCIPIITLHVFGRRSSCEAHFTVSIPARETEKGSAMFMFSDTRRTQIIRILLWTALVLFVLSLLLPSVSLDRAARIDLQCVAPNWSAGLNFLVLGPTGFLDGQFGWIANPLMLFAALTKNRKSSFALTAIVLAAATVAVALAAGTAFSFTSVWGDRGGDFEVCGFGPGYYLWLACSVLVLIATSLRTIRRLSDG